MNDKYLYNKYFAFLMNEIKRCSNKPFRYNEINDFINSPLGQKGYHQFCSLETFQKRGTNTFQHISEVLNGVSL